MGELKFTGKIEIRKTIKYGTILYVVLATLFMPAGICSNQHMALEMALPMVNDRPMPEDNEQFKQFDLYFSPLENVGQYDGAAGGEEKNEDPGDLPFHRPIMRAARTYQVDAALIRAIIFAESNYNPQAVSRVGAQGLMQLMPTTARWLGIEDAFDPELNIDGGVRYFKKLLDRYDGDVKLALAAYNAGSRHVRNYGGVPPFRATRLYIKKVLRYHQKYRQEMVLQVDYS